MKITYLKLVNFAGIYAGLGLKEIEINLNDAQTLTMFLAPNGSGKSVILSSLSPFRESLDGRTNLILKEKEGLKIIKMQHGKDKYEIIHHYIPKKNKSFMKKNGVELNENGGVRTFEALLKSEFNLTTDYIKIGRLGAGVDTFVSLNSTDRKKFIGNFIPNIDDILESFTNSKNAYNSVNRDLKKLEATSNKLGSIEDLKIQKENVTKEYENIKESLELNKKSLYLLENKYQNILGDLSYEETKSELKKTSNLISKNKDKLNTITRKLEDEFYLKYKNLRSYDLEKINTTKIETNNLINECTNKINNNLDKIKMIDEQIENLGLSDIKSFEIDEEEYSNLQDELVNLQNILNEYTEKLEEVLVEEGETVDNLLEEKQHILNLQNSVQAILQDTEEYMTQYNKIQNSNNIINQIELKEIYRDEVSKNKTKLEELRKQTSLLEKRPKTCKNNSCSFIKSAYESSIEVEKLKEYDDIELIDIEDELKKLNQELTKLNSINSYVEKVTNLNNIYFKSNPNYLFELISNKNFDKYCNNEIKTIDNKIQYLKDIDNFEVYKIKYDKTRDSISFIDERKELKAKIEKEYEDKLNRKAKLLEDENNLIAENEQLKATNKKHNTKVSILIRLEEILVNQNELIEETKENIKFETELKEKIEQCKAIIDEIKVYENKVKRDQFEANNIETKKENIIINLKDAERVKNDLDTITKDYNKLKIIKEALDPKIGIPLLFIDSYLTEITEKANTLLDIAYDGKFQIQFNVTESDFFIEVLKSDGTKLKDIKEASQGEFSMTMLSISLALLEQSIDKYNIIYLDEVDATLSTENRRNFIGILQKQIKKLNLEQVFVISHNNEFHSQPLSLILLKEYDIDLEDDNIMENKNVLYKI